MFNLLRIIIHFWIEHLTNHLRYFPRRSPLLTETGTSINWNRDNPPDTTDTGVHADINNLGFFDCGTDEKGNVKTDSNQKLVGHDDWNHIRVRTVIRISGGEVTASTHPDLRVEDIRKQRLLLLDAISTSIEKLPPNSFKSYVSICIAPICNMSFILLP